MLRISVVLAGITAGGIIIYKKHSATAVSPYVIN